MALEFFGDGRDGDLVLTAGNVLTLTRDMYWRVLTLGAGATIHANGYVIRASERIVGPTMADLAVIEHNGIDGEFNNGEVVGGGSLGGFGGQGGVDESGGTGVDPVPVAYWPFRLRPGLGGDGGPADGGLGGSGAAGSALTIATDSDGSLGDIFADIRLRFSNGTPIAGGGGGASGAGDGVGGTGGAGGTGAANIVVLAREFENPDRIQIQAKGGNGQPVRFQFVTGGGGGGGGGIVTVVIYRGAFPSVDVSGGLGGSNSEGATGSHPGSPGQPGQVLKHCFVL